ITLVELSCYTVDVRFDVRFPWARRKPQPSLTRGLLRLMLRAFPQESPAFATINSCSLPIFYLLP
ncbi:hypothetical protein, partial [Lysinibacillus sp. NPDC097868]|uniref:hypothetical protein n=1 Tax=Lysinibacillus sp. NPDC097868 TaxID=3364145 RepID=UPI00380728FB